MVARELIQPNGNGTKPAQTETLDMEIAERVDIVRGIQDRIASLEEKVQHIKEELRGLLEQKGSTWKDAEGYAALVGESVRFSYDTKALDEVVMKNPEQNAWLKDFRKETLVRGGVKIK